MAQEEDRENLPRCTPAPLPDCWAHFSTVDVAGARGTQLTRIKNGGTVTGVYTDALNEQHGLIGQ